MMNSRKIVLRLSASRDAVKSTSWLEEKSYIIGAHLECSCDAYQKKKEGNCSKKSSRESTEIMPHQEHWWARLIDKVSSGELLLLMQTRLFANARDANILLGRYTCRRKSCRLSQSLGCLQFGGSTWSVVYSLGARHGWPSVEMVLLIFSSPLTSSPSGLRPNL